MSISYLWHVEIDLPLVPERENEMEVEDELQVEQGADVALALLGQRADEFAERGQDESVYQVEDL